jgi:hypothetical protein
MHELKLMFFAPPATTRLGPAQVRLAPCRLASADDTDISHALSQLPRLTRLGLGGLKLPDQLQAERAEGRWQVASRKLLTPVAAAVLARSFSGGAGPAGQQQQPAAGAGEQRSGFDVGVKIRPGQASQLASLGRALAAFDAVSLGLQCEGEACPGSVHALLGAVAARLERLGADSSTSAAGGVLEVVGQLALPRLEELALSITGGACDPGAVTAVIALDAPCLATITLKSDAAGSRADAVAAVTVLAMGRPQPVGPGGRPSDLQVAVSEAVLGGEELESVRRVVSTTGRAGWVSVVRLPS